MLKDKVMATKKSGFSLAEMMVVMLLIAVVLVASAPMVTRKMTRDRGTDKIFDMLGSDPRNAVEYIKGRNQRIFMNAKNDGYVGIVETGVEIPKNSVIFGNATVNPASSGFVGVGFNTSVATNSVAIGYNAKANTTGSIAIGQANVNNSNGSVAVGYSARALDQAPNSVAIGYNAIAFRAPSSVAIGHHSQAVGEKSVAVGYSTKAEPTAVAVGNNVKASGSGSVVIGSNIATNLKDTVVIGKGIDLFDTTSFERYGTSDENRIFLGDKDTIVHIRGHLIVGGNTILGERGRGYRTFISHKTYGKDNWHIKSIEVNKNANDDFRWGEDIDTFATRRAGRIINFRTDYDGVNGSSSRQQGSSNSSSRSDVRLKNVGEIYAESLDALSKLNFYHFTFKDDKSKEPQVGVMAQDLQKVFPNSVKADRDGWLTIRWDEMFFAAINAIKELNAKISDIVLDITSLKTSYQEQQATIKSQAEIIETLQKEIASLNDRVEKLENSK